MGEFRDPVNMNVFERSWVQSAEAVDITCYSIKLPLSLDSKFIYMYNRVNTFEIILSQGMKR